MGFRTGITGLILALVCILAGPTRLAGRAGAPSVEAVEAVERFAGPESGDEYVVRYDPASGAKWIEDANGRRYESVAAVASAELREVGEPLCRIDPALREALADPGRAREPVEVLLILAEQPLHDVAEELRPALERDLALEPADARERVLEYRREVYDRAEERCEALQETVVAAVGGDRVTKRTVLVNAVWARVPPADLPGILLRAPRVWRVVPTVVHRTLLDKSVPSVSASSFWNAGYTGTGAYVAVMDTGFDNQHPSLKSGIAYEKAFLAYGSQYSVFGDDTTTDDNHGHGTHCGGIVGGRDSTYTGVAKGVNLVNAKWMWLTTYGQGAGIPGDLFDAVKWVKDNSDVLSCSFGGSTSNNDGSSGDALLLDAVVQSLGIHAAVAAGNSGPSSGTLLTPADAFNVVTVGAYYDNGTTSPSDDSLASYSSRGPTKDGRRKPTIAAPGTYITSANAYWEGSSADYVSASGTSMATPHVAGALGLLFDYKSTYSPRALKALLVNTARNSSPFPSTPDDAWGYGGMDLAAAYSGRADVAEATLTPSGPESLLYARTSSLAYGDRATLVWNRHVAYSSTAWPGTPPALLDLDLYLYDGSTGTEAAKSVSAVNPVEQVKATGTVASPVLRVERAGSFPTAFTSESFALATPSGFSSVEPPALVLAMAAPESPVGPGETFTLTVTVSNDGDLPAMAPSVTLDLPEGYSLASGTNPATLDDVGAGSSADHEFLVKASSVTELATLSADAGSASFGLDLGADSVSRTQQVDATPPSGTVTIDGGDEYADGLDVTLTLSATDEISGVARMRFSDDGTTWSAWEDYATSRSYTLGGGDGTQTVHVQFEDGVGNVSSPATDGIYLDTVGPTGTLGLAGGTACSTTSAVTLALSATDAGSGVADMRLRDSGADWGGWEDYAVERAWTLPSGEGARTVEVQFRDHAGNVSTTVSLEVVVDWTRPSGTVTIEGGAAYVADYAVTVALDASDGLSGVAGVRFSTDGENWSAWQPYTGTAVVTLDGPDGTKTVSVEFQDGAGNVSLVATDTVVLDRTAPTGTLSFPSGYTNEEVVTVRLSASDNLSGVARFRLRNEGGEWSAWRAYAATTTWTLTSLEGPRTVHAQFEDAAGNLSSSASAGIVLDRTPPTGAVVIEEDRPAVNRTDVSLRITSVDVHSGVEAMRFSTDGSTFGEWLPFEEEPAFDLPEGEGEKTVHVLLRDRAGNVSQPFTDRILLDQTPPVADYAVNEGRPYVLPSESLTFAFDDASEVGGSGLLDFRVGFDGGPPSGPISLAEGLVATVPRPDLEGLLSAEVVVRDVAGNESEPAPAPVYLIEEEVTGLVSKARFRGALSPPADVDALGVDVVEGDTITVKLKGKAAEKRRKLLLAVDLIGPWGGRIVTGRFPPGLKRPGIRRFEATVTGRYLVVVRREDGSTAETGTYKVKVKVKQHPDNKMVRGDAPDARIAFEAVDGAILSGRLTVENLAPSAVGLTGPDGPVALTLVDTASGVVIRPTVLTSGTGAYELTADTFRTVGHRLRIRLPKRPRGVLEE